jgi:hypothetical protein
MQKSSQNENRILIVSRKSKHLVNLLGLKRKEIFKIFFLPTSLLMHKKKFFMVNVWIIFIMMMKKGEKKFANVACKLYSNILYIIIFKHDCIARKKCSVLKCSLWSTRVYTERKVRNFFMMTKLLNSFVQCIA